MSCQNCLVGSLRRPFWFSWPQTIHLQNKSTNWGVTLSIVSLFVSHCCLSVGTPMHWPVKPYKKQHRFYVAPTAVGHEQALLLSGALEMQLLFLVTDPGVDTAECNSACLFDHSRVFHRHPCSVSGPSSMAILFVGFL